MMTEAAAGSLGGLGAAEVARTGGPYTGHQETRLEPGAIGGVRRSERRSAGQGVNWMEPGTVRGARR